MKDRSFLRRSLLPFLLLISLFSLTTACDKFGSDNAVAETVAEKKKTLELELSAVDRRCQTVKNELARVEKMIAKANVLNAGKLKIDYKELELKQDKPISYSEYTYLFRRKIADFLRCFDTIKSDIEFRDLNYGGDFGYSPNYSPQVDSSLDARFSDFFNNRLLGDLKNYFMVNYDFNRELTTYNSTMIIELKERLTPEKLNERISILRSYLTSEQRDLTEAKTQMEDLKLTKQKAIIAITTDFNDLKKMSVNRMLISIALPIFGIIILLLMVIPRLYSDHKILSAIFEKDLLVQLITIFLLTATILILGIGDKLSKEVLGTLLGGISVYVLQRASKPSDPPAPSDPAKPETKKTAPHQPEE